MQKDDGWLFPLIDESGRKLLSDLRENMHAPRYTHVGCDRLTAEGLARVKAFENELKTTPIGWLPGEVPSWMNDFVGMCRADVPFYRREKISAASFFSIPTCDRNDLSREPWSFVPDSLPLDDMALYQSSGTTGHPLNIITHPEPLAMYIPLLRAALGRREVTLEGGSGCVAIAQICFQKSTWTYISISPVLGQAAMVKINLNPDDWRDLADREKFLDSCDPEIYTGDPISFAEMMRLPLTTYPKALVSTAMVFSAGLRNELEAHFHCPVFDIYSMNETGPIAISAADGFELLHHRLYVEILDADGKPCNPGERGEIVVSGGFNPFLPLLRYRTGDYASLQFRGRLPVITDLEGRQPVIFFGANGNSINNIDISIALKPFALTQFSLRQSADGSLYLCLRGGENKARLRDVLLQLFGEQQKLMIEETEIFLSPTGKVVQYTSDFKNQK
jgi:phenylacetate-CoA ligase